MTSALRDRLPEPSTKNDSSIWSVLKTCMGKDLSKIAMPVQFNEPLSFLQRVSEYMEYSSLLSDFTGTDAAQRIEMIGAFAVSGMASNWNRLGKPFNPLLHETFELERDGFRFIAEQVSHHPPISAFHAESSEYVFQGWVYPKLKLWGKSVEIHPKGNMKLFLKKFNETYSWSNVNCTVHNIIVGKLWIEHHGTMEINCHESGLKLAIHFKPAGWFNNELHRFEGFITDNKKHKLRYVYGKWTDCFRSTDPESYEDFIKANAHKFKLGDSGANSVEPKKSPSVSPSPPRKIFQKFNSLSIRSFSTSVDPADRPEDLSPESQEEIIPKDQGEVMDIPNTVRRWEVTPRPAHSPEYYHFTLYALSLNQILSNQALCPTDSRLRPDIRHLEEGRLDQAQQEKNRLEERQRKILKNLKSDPQPLYFEKVNDDWQFHGNYWGVSKQDVKNIFD